MAYFFDNTAWVQAAVAIAFDYQQQRHKHPLHTVNHGHAATTRFQTSPQSIRAHPPRIMQSSFAYKF